MSTSLDGSEARAIGATESGNEPTISPPTVLIADGPNRARRYAEWLRDPFPIRCARSLAEARKETSRAVGVAVVGAGVNDEAKSELLELVDVRSPFARTILVQGDDESPMLDGTGYDVCLFTPIEKEALREAVIRLARIATYERAVARFFEYTTHAASLEVGGDEATLASDESYEEIQTGIERTRHTLERIRAEMDETDRRVLMASIEADPAADVADRVGGGGGRHPDECFDCGREWNADGGNGGQPYEQLGAFVWKCTECGGIQQPASASHRWLARR